MSRYSYRVFYSNKELNQIAFMSYNRGYPEDDMLKVYKSVKHTIEMPENYCTKYLKYLLKKFHKEKETRISPYKKLDDFQVVVLNRFIQNNKPWAFLPQILISKSLGISQKTVSRKIKDLLDKDIIKVVKKYKHFERMAHEYVLTKKGYKIVMAMLSVYKREFFEFNSNHYVKLFHEFFPEKLKEEPLPVEEKPKHSARLLYERGWTIEQILGVFPRFRERMDQLEKLLS